MYITNNLGGLGSCSNRAVARMPNCEQFTSLSQGKWQASAAATEYSDALLAANAQNRAKYNTALAKGDELKSQLSGGIVGWLNSARSHVVNLSTQAFDRSDSDAARFAQGNQAATDSWIKYRDYTNEYPSNLQIVSNAAKQAIADIAAGDPFRAAKAQKWGPDILYGPYGFNYKMIGLLLGGATLTLVATYAFATGLGQGLLD